MCHKQDRPTTVDEDTAFFVLTDDMFGEVSKDSVNRLQPVVQFVNHSKAIRFLLHRGFRLRGRGHSLHNIHPR